MKFRNEKCDIVNKGWVESLEGLKSFNPVLDFVNLVPVCDDRIVRALDGLGDLILPSLYDKKIVTVWKCGPGTCLMAS